MRWWLWGDGSCVEMVTVMIALHTFLFSELQESNVRLRLTVISTAGFGDQINKQNR